MKREVVKKQPDHTRGWRIENGNWDLRLEWDGCVAEF